MSHSGNGYHQMNKMKGILLYAYKNYFMGKERKSSIIDIEYSSRTSPSMEHLTKVLVGAIMCFRIC